MRLHRNAIMDRLKTVCQEDNWLDIFLYLVFFSIFLGPFIDSLAVRLLINVFYTFLIIVGVISMSHKRAIRLTAGVLALIAIPLRWVTFFVPSPFIAKIGTLAVVLFLIMLNYVILAKVFSSGRVDTHRVKGAIAVYVLFGLTCSFLYGLLDQVIPNAFNLPVNSGFVPGRQEELTYFSFVTLTTLGYGDILPTHDITRMFVVMEGLVGQLYPATLLARLVSLQLMHGEQTDA